MGKVIGIISIKGGVGKTTLSASVASELVHNYGKKVLLVDANYSAPNLGLHMDIVKPDKTIHDVLAGRERIWGAIHKKFGVDVRDILIELGKRKIIGGQEDIIIDVANFLKQKKEFKDEDYQIESLL